MSTKNDGGAAFSQMPELNNELRWILGRPCFTVARIARTLHEAGIYKADTKAEDEQAVAIHWMLNLYFEHGSEKWREAGEVKLKEIHALLEARNKGE